MKLRVQAPDGRTGTLDDDGNFTADAVGAASVPHRSSSGPNFDPAQPMQGEDKLQSVADNGNLLPAVAASLRAPGKTFALNAAPFGTGTAIAAGVEHLSTGEPFAEARDRIKQEGEDLATQNPNAALAGKGLALGTELATGEAAGGLLAKAGSRFLPSIASKVGQVAESSPLLSSAVKTAAGGAGFGAASGAGEALSNGDNVGQAAKTGAEFGAASGALLGTVGGKLGKLFKEAPASYEDEFAREFIGSSVKKDKKAFSSILNKEAETNVDPEAASKYLRSSDLRPVRDALIEKDYGTALDLAQKETQPLLEARKADYATIDEKAKGIEVGTPYQNLKKALFEAENGAKKDPVAADALSKELERWKTTYTSADTNAVKDVLGRQSAMHAEDSPIGQAFQAVADKLPADSKRVTRTMLAEALDGAPDPVREFVDAKIINPHTGIMAWDPTARMPTVEFRGAVSAAQKNAVSALGTFNPTDAGLRKTAVKIPLNDILEKHLDAVAAEGPAYRKAVDQIRQRDVKLSLLASIKQGIERARTEVQTARYAVPLHERIGRAGGAGAIGALPGLGRAGYHIEEGQYDKLPGDLAGAAVGGLVTHVALPAVVKKVGKAASAVGAASTNGVLAKLQAAAAAGNTRAAKLLDSIMGKTSAALGSAVSGTLANSDQ